MHTYYNEGHRFVIFFLLFCLFALVYVERADMSFNTHCTVDVCAVKAHPQAPFPSGHLSDSGFVELGEDAVAQLSVKRVVCFKVQTPRPGLAGWISCLLPAHIFGTRQPLLFTRRRVISVWTI